MTAAPCNPLDPVSMFNAFAATSLQRELLRGVMAEYGISYAECAERFGSSTLDDVLPHWRCARIEELLVEIAGRMKGCSVRARRNGAGNCSHNLLFIDEKVALTQSKVDDHRQLPRDALFRDTYARLPQTLFAFMHDDNEVDARIGKEVLYGMVIHSPSDAKCLPHFVDIVFPDPTCEFIVGTIPLMEKFPDIVEQILPAEEVVRPEIHEKLRLKQPRVGDATA